MKWLHSRKGMDTAFVIKLILWMVILVLVFFIVKKYVVGPGTSILGPAEGMLP